MNVAVSSSPLPRAHPPRSKPFLRSAAVSLRHPIDGDLGDRRQLHDRVSFAVAPPLVGDLTPTTNATAPIRHRLPDFFENLPGGTPVAGDPPRSTSSSAARFGLARSSSRLAPIHRHGDGDARLPERRNNVPLACRVRQRCARKSKRAARAP